MATLTAPLIFESKPKWDVEVTIPGEPIPWGVGRNPKTGDRFIPNRQSKRRGDIMDAYYRQAPPRGLLDPSQPIEIDLRFYTERPKYHYGTGRNAGVLKDRYLSAKPTGRPDCDNCTKLAIDSLTGVAWKDDDQIVRISAEKDYADVARTEIRIRFGPRF